MRTRNAMQLKSLINNIAKEKQIAPQLALQNYILERVLVRIQNSRYRENFIFKGGFLVGVMIGLDLRTTMDLDTTVRGVNLNQQDIQRIFTEICGLDVDDDFVISLDYIRDIREADDYPGVRVSLIAQYEKMKVPISVDVTTGDVITPAAVGRNIGEELQALTDVIEYAANEDKTERRFYVSSINCNITCARQQFITVK